MIDLLTLAVATVDLPLGITVVYENRLAPQPDDLVGYAVPVEALSLHGREVHRVDGVQE